MKILNRKLSQIKKSTINIHYLFLIMFLFLFFTDFNNFDFYCVETTRCNCIYKYDNPWPHRIDIYNCDGRYATSGWWYFKAISFATGGYVIVNIGIVLLLHYRGEL